MPPCRSPWPSRCGRISVGRSGEAHSFCLHRRGRETATEHRREAPRRGPRPAQSLRVARWATAGQAQRVAAAVVCYYHGGHWAGCALVPFSSGSLANPRLVLRSLECSMFDVELKLDRLQMLGSISLASHASRPRPCSRRTWAVMASTTSLIALRILVQHSLDAAGLSRRQSHRFPFGT